MQVREVMALVQRLASKSLYFARRSHRLIVLMQ